MQRSRLRSVRSKRETQQGILYLIVALAIIVGMFVWGLPGLAKLAGLVSKPESTTTQNTDLKPTPPVFTDVPEATGSAKINLSGFAQPGVNVALYVNGAEVERKLSTDSGTFSFSNVPLASGDNQIYAYTYSTRGLQSEQSDSYTVTLDTEPPKLTINSPKDGDSFMGQAQRIVTFNGSVDTPGSKVYIGDRMVIVQTDNSFSQPYQLVQGEQQIPIKAIDPAGNETDMTIKLTWNP